MTKRLKITSIIPFVALFPAGLAGFLFLFTRPGRVSQTDLFFFFPLAVCLVTLFCIPFVTTRLKYYSAQTIIGVAYLFTILWTVDQPHVMILVHIIIVGELILYEPYPLNLYAGVGVSLCASAAFVFVQLNRDLGVSGVLEHLSLFLVPGLVIAILGSLMTKHRELVVDLLEDRRRLTDSVVNLTRANSAYQDYAVIAQENATEKERQRITRDIHDIVGYTLTNNMMLMEAAIDLLKENALALPSIIETARENAQEGLNQVREAMYKLREQESEAPIGLNAIVRLIRIFEQATGIKVIAHFRNMPMMITDEIDSVVYHLIQEALVNSFRHGGASEVNVSFWYSSEQVQVAVRDNGKGSGKIIEGIGIRGMKERIEKVGGSLIVGNVVDGFLIDATIPLQEWKNYE